MERGPGGEAKNKTMKTKTFFTFLSIIFIALFSCKKDFDTPTGGNKIEFGNTTVDSVSYSWVQITTQFTSTGGNTITQHGHCWSTETEPTIEDNHTSLGKLEKPKTFQSQIEELSSNTAYFIRSYFTYQNGTVYGNQETITTLKTGKPVIITSDVTDITLISAVCGGTVLSDSGLFVTARGVCWDTINEFNIDDCLNKTINGDSLGAFTSNITELTDGKDYFVKAYATNEKGTGYGDIKTFSTIPLSVPEVQTSNISDITTISAVSGGDVLSNGNGNVTARGICWSISENVSIENYDGITENGTGTGSFISNLTDLADGTIYYVVAYAINEKGTGYGEVRSFNTLELTLPSVTTSNVTNITINSAQCGGNVINDGNGTVSARGVCWNTTGNPSLENCDNYTIDGIGLGNYISNITGLEKNTTYYIVAYATNEKGTGYGNVKSFTTENFVCGETIFYGGQTYNTILISDQCWMKENLNIGTKINGADEQTDNGIIEKYCYDDDVNNCNEYGGLYQWDEMMQYTTQQGTQGICPYGWHLPTDEEWKTLEGAVDSQYGVGDPIWDEIGWRGFDACKKLKSTTGWYQNGNGTNNYDFSAFPGGYRNSNGYFTNIEEQAYFWSSTENNNFAWCRGLYYLYDESYRYSYYKSHGLSVRCVMD